MILIKFAYHSLVMGLPIGGVIVAENAANDIPPWLQYGVLGLVIVALVVTKQLVPGWIHQEVRLENKELKEENRTLTKLVFETQKAVLPVLEKSTSAIEEAIKDRRERS